MIAAACLIASAPAATLGVNHVDQRTTDPNGNPTGSNWCWAACSKMVLDYYGYPQSLHSIAAYGIGNATYDTWNYLGGTGSESRTGVVVWELNGAVYEKKVKTITISYNGIEQIIGNFSAKEVQTQYYGTTLTAAQITKEIDDYSAPFFVRIGWAPGGGHFIVCYGTAAGNHSIRDPWFGSYLISDASLRTSKGIDSATTHTWTHTLTTSKIVDVLFLFDSTGSMSDDIANAKANATTLLNNIATKFKNYRVAVADYKDFPQSPYGDPSDYTYNPRVAFTSDLAAVQAGINSLTASGGNDWPESVYTALRLAIRGDGIGTWRENPARRIIILIGDAPGHDPEPWLGGSSFAAVRSLATDPLNPIAVHCLLVGTDIDAKSQYNLIAGGTGGSVVEVSGAGNVSVGLQAIINSVAAESRTPKGTANNIYPVFTFQPEGQGGMANDALALILEVQRNVDGTWVKHSLTTLKNKKATILTSTKPYPLDEYRWRLGFKRKAGKLYLPEGTIVKTSPATVMETEWTEFTRGASPPGEVSLLTPSATFVPSAATMTFEFGAVPGATSYVMQLLQGGTVIKTFKIKAPKGGAAVLRKKIAKLNTTLVYQWRVQGLNYDRPVVDDSAW
jgi:hypothetical protein